MVKKMQKYDLTPTNPTLIVYKTRFAYPSVEFGRPYFFNEAAGGDARALSATKI